MRATPSIDIVPPKWEEGDMPSFDASDMPSFAAEDLVTSTPPRARRGSGESTATAKARAQPKDEVRPNGEQGCESGISGRHGPLFR